MAHILHSSFFIFNSHGGTYAFTLVNGAKLLQVDGGTLQTKEIGMRAMDAIGLFSQSDYVSWLDHSLHGADHWHSLMPGNLFFDNVSFPVIRQWGNGGSFTWPIPNIWRVSRSEEPIFYIQ